MTWYDAMNENAYIYILNELLCVFHMMPAPKSRVGSLSLGTYFHTGSRLYKRKNCRTGKPREALSHVLSGVRRADSKVLPLTPNNMALPVTVYV